VTYIPITFLKIVVLFNICQNNSISVSGKLERKSNKAKSRKLINVERRDARQIPGQYVRRR